MLVERTGVPMLAVDPGGTTGIALWDPWDQQLYVDQLDAGVGRFAQHWAWPGKVESWARRHAEVKLELEDISKGVGGSVTRVKAGMGRGKGLRGEVEVMHTVERGVVNMLETLMLAMGPQGFVIVEDFVLGHGNPKNVRTSERGLLAPVRLHARIDDRFHLHGLSTGDAWRTWSGHAWRGADKRGWHVGGAVPPLWERMRAVMYWYQTGKNLATARYLGEDVAAEEVVGSVWAGGGHKLVTPMPVERLWLGGKRDLCERYLRERGMWRVGMPHGMDALMHLMAVMRKIGVEILCEPRKIWVGFGEGGMRAKER